MNKIGYYYNGNEKYINQLNKYDLTIIFENEKDISDILKYNCNFKKKKYDNNFYDVLISEKDNIKDISASKKVIIGNVNEYKNKVYYYDKFDLDKGVKFRTYASLRIRGAIIDSVRNLDWIPRSLRQKSKELEKLYSDLENNCHYLFLYTHLVKYLYLVLLLTPDILMPLKM